MRRGRGWRIYCERKETSRGRLKQRIGLAAVEAVLVVVVMWYVLKHRDKEFICAVTAAIVISTLAPPRWGGLVSGVCLLGLAAFLYFGKGLHDFREAMRGFEREIREEALGEKSVTPRLQPPRQAPVARGDAAGPSRPASQVAEQADGAGAASPRPENPAGQDPA